MAKHSKFENERRAAETVRTKEIEAAWFGSLSKPTAEAFTLAVATARARPPQGPFPNMPREPGRTRRSASRAQRRKRRPAAPAPERDAERDDAGPPGRRR